MFDVLCADVFDAFAEAARRQTESLAGAERRLSGLARRCRATVELDDASALKSMITTCVADAADENVKIWADLVKRVQDNCARFEAAKGASSADGLNDEAAGRPPSR